MRTWLPIMFAVGVFAEPAQAGESPLAIRGARTLASLMEPVPALKELSISPDGKYVLFVASLPRGDTLAIDGEMNGPLAGTNGPTLRNELRVVAVDTGNQIQLSQSNAELQAMTFGNGRSGTFAPRWAHDSSRVAFLRTTPGEIALVEWSIAGEAVRRENRLPRVSSRLGSQRRIKDWIWLSERSEIYLWVSPNGEHGEESGTPPMNYPWVRSRDAKGAINPAHWHGEILPLQVVRVNLATEEMKEMALPRPIFPAHLGVHGAQLSHDRRHVFFSSSDPASLANSMSESYFLKMAATGDARAAAFMQARHALYSLDLETGSTRTIYHDGPSSIMGFHVMGDGRRALGIIRDPELSVWPVNGAFAHLRLLQEDLAQSPIVLPSPLVVPTRVFASAEAGRVFLHEGRFPENEISLLDLATGERVPISPEGLSASWCDVSADGKHVAAVLENANQAPAIWIRNSDDKRWRRITPLAPRNSQFRPIEKFTWRSRDDRFELDGFLIKPTRFESRRRYPLLVFIHGGQGAGHRNEYSSLFGEGGLPARVFAEEGYLVFMPTFRGDHGRTPEFSRALIGNLGNDYTFDIEAGIDALIAKGWVDDEKIGLLGHSFGALQVMYAISHTNRIKAAAINDGGMFLLEDFIPEFVQWYDFPGNTFGSDALRILCGFDPMIRPWIDPQKIRTPLLVRHGLATSPGHEDGVYTVSYQAGMRGAHHIHQVGKLQHILKANGVAFEQIVDRDGHVITDKDNLLEYQSRLLQWFDHYLLGKGDGPTWKGGKN